MEMTEDLDLSEIEERLYSQIYHSTEQYPEPALQHNDSSLNMNPARRYFNTGINSISLRIDVSNDYVARQLYEGASQDSSNNLEGVNKRRSRPQMEPRMVRKQQNNPNQKFKARFKNKNINFDLEDVDMKEIKAQVDAVPGYIKCLPSHIRKKLNKMNKRISYIQRKKQLEQSQKLNLMNRNASIPIKPKIVATLKSNKPNISQESNVISISDDSSDCGSFKPNKNLFQGVKLEKNCTSSASEAYSSASKNNNFKRPDDDDVIFVEPTASDIIVLENDAESNSSFSTKSSVDQIGKNVCKTKSKLLIAERKELLSTPESNNSNDFLETSLIDNGSGKFNFSLHGNDFVPSKDTSKQNVKDVSGSESSCSVAACDLGGLIASNKCALFNEVDFDSPTKDIFDSNLESFGQYITPNRRNVSRNLQSSPVQEDLSEIAETAASKKSKKRKDALPNLSCIVPPILEQEVDAETSSILEDVSRKKTKKKKLKKSESAASEPTDDVESEISYKESVTAEDADPEAPISIKKKKKTKIIETFTETTDIEISLCATTKSKKKKRKKISERSDLEGVSTDKEEVPVSGDSTKKNKRKTRKDSALQQQVDTNEDNFEIDSSFEFTETENILLLARLLDNSESTTTDDIVKKKKRNTKKDAECPADTNDVIQEGSVTPKNKKRKYKNAPLISPETEITNPSVCLEGEIAKTATPKKRRRKPNKFDNADSVIIDETPKKLNKRQSKAPDVDANEGNDSMEEPLVCHTNTNSAKILDIKSIDTSTDSIEPVEINESCTTDVEIVDVPVELHIVDSSSSEYDIDVLTISSKSDSDDNLSDVNVDGADIKVVNIKISNKKRFNPEVGLEEKEYTDKILNTMSDDPDKWKILRTDRMPARSPKLKLRCRRCRENGHYANQCTNKPVVICCLCSARGHMEPRCPNKICTNCGRRSNYFTTFCSRCAHTKHAKCNICKMNGHYAETCPDLWRRYHLTISAGTIVRPRTPVVQIKKWCSGCGKRGHLEYQCQYFARDHYPTKQEIVEYKDHLYRSAGTIASIASSEITNVNDYNSNDNLKRKENITEQPDVGHSKKKRHSVEKLGSPIIEPGNACSEKGEQISPNAIDQSLENVRKTASTRKSTDRSAVTEHNNRTKVKTTAEESVLDQETRLKNTNLEQSASIDPLTAEQSMSTNNTSVKAHNFAEKPVATVVGTYSESIECMPSTSSDRTLFKITSSSHERKASALPQPCSPDISNDVCQLQISFLRAIYLLWHEDGVDFIKNLGNTAEVNIDINSSGSVFIHGSLSHCELARLKLLTRLRNNVCTGQTIIPSHTTDILNYIDDILKELSKECNLDDLKDDLSNVKENVSEDRSKYCQQLNMKIYGKYHWEYGSRYIRKLKTISTEIKENSQVNIGILEELNEYIKYLIEYERPLNMYDDIVEAIFDGRTNFIDVATLKTINSPSHRTFKVVIDDLKYDYVKNSYTAQFLICQWKTKLKIDICYEWNETVLYFEGDEKIISSALNEFRMLIVEGPMLPSLKYPLYNIVAFILNKIETIQNNLDKFVAVDAISKIAELENKQKSAENAQQIMSLYEQLHTYLFAGCGLQDGKEKQAILQEFVNNYKPSITPDVVDEREWKDIQDAYVVLQYSKHRTLADYKCITEKLSLKRQSVSVILNIDEVKILNRTVSGRRLAEELHRAVLFDLTTARYITKTKVAINIVGSPNDIVTYKEKLYEFLDRAYIVESSMFELRDKLTDALETIWQKPLDKNKVETILNRIFEIEASPDQLHNVEVLRELYQQLHIFLFGQCKLLCGKNNILLLKVLVKYLEQVQYVSHDILDIIFTTYTYIFRKSKMPSMSYRQLMQTIGWDTLENNSLLDKNTICIFDRIVKRYFLINSNGRQMISHYGSILSLSVPCDVIRKFVEECVLLISNTNEIKNKLPVIIRSQSAKIFVQTHINISTDLLTSLRALDEIGRNLCNEHAIDLLRHIELIEDNIENRAFLEEKYQILNIYLFGCCHLMEGAKYLDELNNLLSLISKAETQHCFLSDENLTSRLITAYEYIFWKGKKEHVDYELLLYRLSINNQQTIQVLPLQSNSVYEYFLYVTEGIAIIRQCSETVKVDFDDDVTYKNRGFLKLTGEYEMVIAASNLISEEINRIQSYRRIPFRAETLYQYLIHKVNELAHFNKDRISFTILNNVRAFENMLSPLIPYQECENITSQISTIYTSLHNFIFGVCKLRDGEAHVERLNSFINNFENNRRVVLDLDEIILIHTSMQYLFSYKQKTGEDYHMLLKECLKIRNDTRIQLELPETIYKYFRSTKDINEMPSIFKNNLDNVTNQVWFTQSELFSVNNTVDEYKAILLNLPTTRNDLRTFIKDFFKRIADSSHYDPSSLCHEINELKSHNSQNSTDLNTLFTKLHTHIFGYCQLGKGKVLTQVLNQHCYNLEHFGNLWDIVSITSLQEIYCVLQYIEGCTEKLEDYQHIILTRDNIDVNKGSNNASITYGEKNVPKTTTMTKKISKKFFYYLNTRSGSEFLTSIKQLARVKLNPRHIICTGSRDNIDIAISKISTNAAHYDRDIDWRKKIKAGMQMFVVHKNMDVGKAYTNLFENTASKNSKRRSKVNKRYRILHSYMFGVLKLLDGEHHMNILNTFLRNAEPFQEKISTSYNYIFGNSRKNIDYSIILQKLNKLA